MATSRFDDTAGGNHRDRRAGFASMIQQKVDIAKGTSPCATHARAGNQLFRVCADLGAVNRHGE
jgi:hypothetical protein